MAYAIDNPVKKIAQMGPSNSMWYYTDGDAIGDIDNDDYFILSYRELTAGDIIIVIRTFSSGSVDTCKNGNEKQSSSFCATLNSQHHSTSA